MILKNYILKAASFVKKNNEDNKKNNESDYEKNFIKFSEKKINLVMKIYFFVNMLKILIY